MKQLISKLLCAGFLVLLSGGIYAQTTFRMDFEPTPENVMKWTKEALPKMELLVPKLDKIKASNPGKPTTDALKLLAAVNYLKEINVKGARLKSSEAKRYYDLIAEKIKSFYIDCQSQNGNFCCIECHNNPILGSWCIANCFVARFPGIN